MKKLIFLTFLAFMTLSPSLSIANPLPSMEYMKAMCVENCLDCANNTFLNNTENGLCRSCDSLVSPDEFKNRCLERSKRWCTKYCYDCKNQTFIPDGVCEKCLDMIDMYDKNYIEEVCKDDACLTMCDAQCINCETQSIKDGPKCDKCTFYCDKSAIQSYCYDATCRERCADCLDCKTMKYKRTSKCLDKCPNK